MQLGNSVSRLKLYNTCLRLCIFPKNEGPELINVLMRVLMIRAKALLPVLDCVFLFKKRKAVSYICCNYGS